MSLKCHTRRKDGKEHRYWSLMEKRRVADGRILDRPLLYLGEINDAQQAAWPRTIAAFDPVTQRPQILALFPAARPLPAHAADFGVQVRLSEFRLQRPRQWGACWLALQLWDLLQLGEFWRPRLPDSREGTSWYHLLQVLTVYRLIDPGSEWRLHREWFLGTALTTAPCQMAKRASFIQRKELEMYRQYRPRQMIRPEVGVANLGSAWFYGLPAWGAQPSSSCCGDCWGLGRNFIVNSWLAEKMERSS